MMNNTLQKRKDEISIDGAENISKTTYSSLINTIGGILEEGRKKASRSVNQILVQTYWTIGKTISDFENASEESTRYGSGLFESIARDLRQRYGKGFSRTNIVYMRLLYQKHQKSQTLSDQLSWSHFVELLSLEDDLARGFYERQCITDGWSVRELRRQINSALFHRLALSKNKKGVMQLALKGNIIERSQDIIKDPYILEFLKLSEREKYSEKELEQEIIDNLQSFLLELGKGFTFVGRQYRITLDNNHFYVDLVFYHRILKCFVLIDLKVGKVTHQDIGQMNMYLNYFKKEESDDLDNPPIGIILGKEKEKLTIEYALGSIKNNLFVSNYQLYLPTKEEIEEVIRKRI